jgi:hypothetical protein
MTTPATSTPARTRKATAQPVDIAFNFLMTETALASIPVLPPNGAVGRDGRGPFTFDINTVVANIRANAQDIPVFIDHETGKALGWIDHKAQPVQAADGSWEWPVSYTAEGRELVASKGYRYNSPTFLYIQNKGITGRAAGVIVGILEVSLTNLPNLVLRALNSLDAGGGYTVDIPTEDTMTPEQIAMLGLGADATPEDCTAALAALVSKCADCCARLDSILSAACCTAEVADAVAVVDAACNSRVTSGALVTKQAFDEVAAARDAATTAQATAEQALVSFKAEQHALAVTAAVDGAIADGKFTPATRDSLHALATSNFEQFTNLATNTAKNAALKSLATPNVADTTFGLTADQLAICKQNGILPELFANQLRKTS